MEEIAESIVSDIEREDEAYDSHMSKSNNIRPQSINRNNIAGSQSSNSVSIPKSM